MLATTCSAVTASSGTRRPTLSLSGPTISWPSAKPSIVPVRVSWIAAAVVWKSVLEHRERRQIEVDRERAQRRQRAEQDDVEHPAPVGDRVARVQHDRRRRRVRPERADRARGRRPPIVWIEPVADTSPAVRTRGRGRAVVEPRWQGSEE